VLTVTLALGAALAYAVSDMLVQRVTRGGASVTSTLTWVLATGTAVTVPAALITAGLPHGRAEFIDAGYAAAGGAAYLVAYGSIVRGLRVGNLSLVTPLASLQGAVTAVGAIFLFGEHVTGATAAGLALAVAGGAIAAGAPSAHVGRASGQTLDADERDRDVGEHHRRAAAGAGWGLLCALAFGVALLFYGAAQSISPVTAVAVSRIVSLALVLPLALHHGVRVPRKLRGTAVLSGALESGAFLLAVVALAVGPLAVASVLVAQYATFAVLLGLVAVHERPSWMQLAGVLCTIVAVSVLALA
jgi:drug/metabolite transporter (DMT)-like permease